MQKISIKTVSAQGVETVQILVRSDDKPVRVIPAPGSKMYVEVDGLLQPVNPKSKSDASKDMQIKQVGKDLVLESEGEALVEMVDFYATSGATLNGASWSYAEDGVSTQVTVSPESLALNSVGLSGTGAADSSSLVSSPSWLSGLMGGGVVLGAAAAAGSSGAAAPAVSAVTYTVVVALGPLENADATSVTVEFYRADTGAKLAGIAKSSILFILFTIKRSFSM